MKRKILIMTAAALLTLGLATVSAQSPAPAEEVPGELVYDVVEPQRYEAETPAYTVDANGNITLDVELNLKGDVNQDGLVNFNDLQRLYQHLSTSDNKVEGYALVIANTNEDGLVNFNDLQRLYQHLTTTDNKFE